MIGDDPETGNPDGTGKEKAVSGRERGISDNYNQVSLKQTAEFYEEVQEVLKRLRLYMKIAF